MKQYQKHKRKWKNCNNCSYHIKRTRVVLCRGKLPCDILFVGEAPGQSEDIIGEPFIGPAGKLLQYMIDTALENEYTCAFTNLVACIPKAKTNQKIAKPEPKHIKACKPRLEELIKLANPKVIIAVGKLAARHVEGTPITHPAALLRMDISRRVLEIQRATMIIADAVEEIPPF